jgi:hypothetical protein
MDFRGVNYDVGTYFGPSRTSAFDLSADTLKRDFNAARDQLNCNAVQIYGFSPDRIALAATLALELGLKLWLEPRLVDGSHSDMLDQLDEVSTIGQRLIDQGGDVTLNVGCELSIFAPGIISGDTYQDRIAALEGFNGDFSEANRCLDAFLEILRSRAAPRFSGRITYAAAPWESPDWSRFNIIGLDHYRMALNQESYVDILRQHVGSGKPVVITEFGCCAYGGADQRGPSGYDIIDWSGGRPRIVNGIVRNENVQARYVDELLEIFEREKVLGAFVYTFSNTDLVHDTRTAHDLDLASFGIAKAVSPVVAGSYEWVEKKAFHVVAKRFGRLTK